MFDHKYGEPLGHGAYDLTKLDESLLENRIAKGAVEEVVYELYKNSHWIPAFPLDGRSSYGTIIVSILAIWLLVFMVLGATHRVIDSNGALITLGCLLLAYVVSWGLTHWVNSPISDSYLHEREREFNRVIDAWNSKHHDKDYKIEVGRYGAFLCLRFQTPIKKLGAFLMHYKRQQEREKENPNNHQEDIL